MSHQRSLTSRLAEVALVNAAIVLVATVAEGWICGPATGWRGNPGWWCWSPIALIIAALTVQHSRLHRVADYALVLLPAQAAWWMLVVGPW